MELQAYLGSKNWDISGTLSFPEKEGKLYGYDDLGLSRESIKALKKYVPNGVYRHQKEAIRDILSREHVCLTTGTASGKSLVFYVAAVEQLVKNPNSKIIASYPMTALGREQEDRWRSFLKESGLDINVGRIDGNVKMPERLPIIKNSQILILTPDIIHAWLLFNVGNKIVANFLQRLFLMIVDETHNYTGVFGSNSAYLFRRIRHLQNILGSESQYISASATITQPETHLKKLFGLDFKIIDSEYDTSPRKKLDIRLVNPTLSKDFLNELSGLIEFIALKTEHKFIVFVDSRKQTEYIASIVSRSNIKEDDELSFVDDFMERLDVLPYRAGYEEHDRHAIQEKLSKGKLKGVISTSALELGIDIPYLTMGILVGVPRSATSFYQRIGRIGRHINGEILIINTGDMYNESIFSKPEQLMNIPLSEGALYLENPRIQYIHALCLARNGGEYDKLCSIVGKKESSEISTDITWPDGFIDLCKAERVGEISVEFQNMKAQAGDDPNHAFPLRDVDLQFQVKHRRGPTEDSLGSLSFGQLMREAYPGAVYNYITKPYRVFRVNIHKRLVEVRKEKKYTTKPIIMPSLVYPNLTQGNVYVCRKHDDLLVAESALQIREALTGFREFRGPNELLHDYPLDPSMGIYFDQPRFQRYFFTTGVVFTHPSLNNSNVQNDLIAQLLFEVFLMVIPFERRDVAFSNDKHRRQRGIIKEGDKFASIYDQTYGSLRLSGRILETSVLNNIVDKLEAVIDLSKKDGTVEKGSATLLALEQILNSLSRPYVDFSFDSETELPSDTDHYVQIIKPGSKGINVKKDNEEFYIDGVFFSPVFNKLAYRGKHISENGQRFDDAVISIPIDFLIEIPGESEVGRYNLGTGEIIDINKNADRGALAS